MEEHKWDVIDLTEIRKAIECLNNEGIVFEEQFGFMWHHYINYHQHKLEEILIENGYEGDILVDMAEFSPEGPMFAIFNPSIIDPRDVKNLIINHFEI